MERLTEGSGQERIALKISIEGNVVSRYTYPFLYIIIYKYFLDIWDADSVDFAKK